MSIHTLIAGTLFRAPGDENLKAVRNRHDRLEGRGRTCRSAGWFPSPAGRSQGAKKLLAIRQTLGFHSPCEPFSY